MSALEGFPDRLRRLRGEVNLSQDQLGEFVGCSGRAIGHYEQGIREPTGRLLLGLARELGVTPEYLLLGSVFA